MALPFPHSYHKGLQWVCYWLEVPHSFHFFPSCGAEKWLVVQLAQVVYYTGPDDS